MRFWDLFFKSLLGRDARPESGTDADTAPAESSIATLESRGACAAGEDHLDPDRWWTPSAGALTEVAPVIAPQVAPEALALERILIEYFEKTDLRLPSLPKVAERVLRELSGQTCNAQKIADEIAADQVISVAVLRLANSALYGRSKRISDLHTAVARLGSNVLRSLMLQHSLQAALQNRRGGDRRLAGIVWHGSLASAHILRGLAVLVGAEPEEAYLVGLLHDIGTVLVLREVQEQEALLRYQIGVGDFAWLCAKHHERLGQLIADAWELPERLKTLVANHHRPVEIDDAAACERNMIALDDMLKAMLGYAPPGSYDLLRSAPARSLGLDTQPAFAIFLDGLPAMLREIPTSF